MRKHLCETIRNHSPLRAGPYAQLLADYIDALARRLPTLPAGNEKALSRAISEMLVACLSPSLNSIEAARPGLEMVLLRRAKRFIEVHLDSAELTTAAVCNNAEASRRTIYRLFQRDGGIQHYIQARRLERIKAALSDPGETRRISEVAAEFGFLRGDHFARAFTNQYGQSARDVREEAHQ